jgi:GNAT superfamily N-acetyltransferase
VLAGFSCGRDALDEWLLKRAPASQVSGAARTYVVEAEDRVVGYFSLATASVAHTHLTGRARRNMPDPVPAVLLARFATDVKYQGKGLGKAMLRSAVEQVKRAAEAVGVACLLVHAKDDGARDFYVRYGSEPSPTDPLHLVLLLEDVPSSLQGQ